MRNLRISLAALFICSALALLYRSLIGPSSSKAIVNLEALLGSLFIASFCVSRRQDIDERYSTGSAPLTVCGLAILPFLITLNAPLLYDSYSHVVTASTESWAEVLRTAYVHPKGGDFFFRPLGYVDYWIDSKWAGFDPSLWHASNLLFHLIAIYLLAFLCKRLGLSSWASVFSALLFGLHGTGPEVVSWVAARFDELSTCFVLLTLLALCAYTEGRRTLSLMVGSCLCALLSKEAAFCIPGLAVCCLWYRGQLDRRGLKAIATLAVTCALVFIYRTWVLGGIGGYKDVNGAPTILHFSLAHMLELLLFRTWGVLLFPVNWARSPSNLPPLAFLLFVSSAAVAMVLSDPKTRRVVASLGFVIISLVPVAHLALLDSRLTGSRVFHLSVIGFALLTGAVYDGFRSRKIAALFMGGFLIFQGAALIHNLLIWRATAYLAGRTCSAFPAMLDGRTRAVVLDLPRTYDGVFFLFNGFSDCVYVNTGKRISITQATTTDSSDAVFTWDVQSHSLKQIR